MAEKCRKCGSLKIESYKTVRIDDWTKEKFEIETVSCFKCGAHYDKEN